MKTTLGVLLGGRSVEHEISVISALQVIHAIDRERYEVVPVYLAKEGPWYTGAALLDIENYKDLQALKQRCIQVVPTGKDCRLLLLRETPSLLRKNIVAKIDVALPVTHGTHGEDGCLQGLLQLYDVPYVGCDVTASALGMDKVRFKEIGQQRQLPLVDYYWFAAKTWYTDDAAVARDIGERIGFPLIVKPANLGSSIGVTVVKQNEALDDAVSLAASFAERIIVEKLVANLQEINCAVLGDQDECQPSVCEEPLLSSEFLSFTDKYQSKGSNGGSKGMQSAGRRIPADIDPELSGRVQHLAMQTFQAIGANGVARIDCLVNRVSGEVYVNEINTIPGSLSFYLWEPSGISFDQLINRLVALALQRGREQARLMRSNPHNILALSAKSS